VGPGGNSLKHLASTSEPMCIAPAPPGTCSDSWIPPVRSARSGKPLGLALRRKGVPAASSAFAQAKE
jgi:hypothetical protein